MSSTLNIMIVEDEVLVSEMLKDMIEEFGYSVITEAKSLDEALQILEFRNTEIDLVCLDINLEKGEEGLEIARTLKKDYGIPFLFITSYGDHSMIKKATATGSEGYLIKPFKKNHVFAAMETIRFRITDRRRDLLIKEGYQNKKINADDVVYMKSDNNYIEIHTTAKRYTMRTSLDKFLQDNPILSFQRTHRSYVVNTNHVTAIKSQTLIANGLIIPLSRKYKKTLDQLFQ